MGRGSTLTFVTACGSEWLRGFPVNVKEPFAVPNDAMLSSTLPSYGNSVMPPKRDQSDTVQLKIRMKEPLRKKIEDSARVRGLSLSAEMVDRLEISFEYDRRMEDIFGSRQIFDILKIVASVMNEAGSSQRRHHDNAALDDGSTWLSDPDAYGDAFDAAKLVLEALRPNASAGFRFEAGKDLVDRARRRFAAAGRGLSPVDTDRSTRTDGANDEGASRPRSHWALHRLRRQSFRHRVARKVS
jgi:hypothetical protein